MPRWTVRTRDELDEGVTAEHLEINGGALIFSNGNYMSDIVIAYAPHTWNSVHRDDED